MRLELPDLRPVAELLRRPSPALLERRPRGEPLPAVAVVRAEAGERVGLAVVRDQQVAELRVDSPWTSPPPAMTPPPIPVPIVR